MKQLFLALLIVFGMSGMAYGAGRTTLQDGSSVEIGTSTNPLVTSIDETDTAVLSSGYKAANTAITTVSTTVYGFTGISKTASGPAYLVDGDVGDSTTVARQLVTLVNLSDEDELFYWFPNGIQFPNGCMLITEVAGTENAEGQVFYTTP